MQLQVALIGTMPNHVMQAFESDAFDKEVDDVIFRDRFGIRNPGDRPSEFHVVVFYANVTSKKAGVAARLVDVSRTGRENILKPARIELHDLIVITADKGLKRAGSDQSIQTSATLVLDGETNIDGLMTNLVEGHAVMVHRLGAVVSTS